MCLSRSRDVVVLGVVMCANESADADLCYESSSDDFMGIVEGRGMTFFMFAYRRLQLTGDKTLLQHLFPIFRVASTLMRKREHQLFVVFVGVAAINVLIRSLSGLLIPLFVWLESHNVRSLFLSLLPFFCRTPTHAPSG
jgi:hypothetical protein